MTKSNQVVVVVNGEDNYLNSIVYSHLIDFFDDKGYTFNTNSKKNEIILGESNYDYQMKMLISKHGKHNLFETNKGKREYSFDELRDQPLKGVSLKK